MKKSYRKPYLGVESFQLNAAVAEACSTAGREPIHYGESNCSTSTKENLLGFFCQSVKKAANRQETIF